MRQLIAGGQHIDALTPAELSAFWAEQQQAQSARDRERYRSVKHMRLPQTLSGKPASSAITLGVSKGQQAVGPALGWSWVVRRLIVSGLTSGASPDVVNLYLNDAFNYPPVWQFNGNNFGYTFGKGEIVLYGGDTFSLQNSGTIAATGLITLAGEVVEVATERLGEYLS